MSGGPLRRIILDDQNHDDLVGGGDVGVGPWREDFVTFPPVTSQLRYRLVPGGLQIAGSLAGTTFLAGQGRREVGTMPAGYRPASVQILVGTVITSGGVFAFGTLDIASDGRSYLMSSVDSTQFGLNAVMALD